MTTTQPVQLQGPRKSNRYGITLVSESEGRWATVDGRYLIEKVTEDDRCIQRHPGCPGWVLHTYERWQSTDAATGKMIDGGLATFKAAAMKLARRLVAPPA